MCADAQICTIESYVSYCFKCWSWNVDGIKIGGKWNVDELVYNTVWRSVSSTATMNVVAGYQIYIDRWACKEMYAVMNSLKTVSFQFEIGIVESFLFCDKNK